MVIVDSNVHLDLLTRDPLWFEWSSRALRQARQAGLFVINQIIAAELANSFATEQDLNDYVSEESFVRENLPWEAAFLVGRVFQQYKARGGNKLAPLPDFYIGAHALIAGHTLLTRDATRYKTYFPKLKLISP